MRKQAPAVKGVHSASQQGTRLRGNCHSQTALAAWFGQCHPADLGDGADEAHNDAYRAAPATALSATQVSRARWAPTVLPFSV
jgi:hypothetical protein